jgi:hypothetical protein
VHFLLDKSGFRSGKSPLAARAPDLVEKCFVFGQMSKIASGAFKFDPMIVPALTHQDPELSAVSMTGGGETNI